MAEYIEREALLNDFESCNKQNPRWTPQRVKTLIMRTHRADVVEVVRCKDCRRRYDADECPMCVLIDGEYLEYTNGNGFCDRGERRADNAV